MPWLPHSDSSLLVRTDFADDHAWELLRDEAQRENGDGFRAYVQPVDDAVFDAASWEAVRGAVPLNLNGAVVLFIADTTTLTSADHPVLVVDLTESRNSSPFRCIPSELWSIENNLNIANMDWEEFAGATDDDGTFRGFDA